MEIQTLPHQYELLKSDARFNLLIGGIGSGKSYVAGDLLVKFRAENINNEVFISANTHKQLRDSTIKAITDRLAFYGFNDSHYNYEENRGFFNFMGMKCYLRSLENIDKAIAGLTVDKIITDEYAFCGRPNQTPEYIHKKIIQRLRGKNGVNQFYALTSPNGVNFLHDVWVTNKTKDHFLVQAKTKDNIFLPDGYYESLVSAYGGEDTPLAKQELFGQFINVTENRTYYAFSEDNIADVKRVNGSILIGLDFNVEPMCGIVAQYVNGKIFVIDEVIVDVNADTYKWSDLAIKKGYAGAIIYPDHTGGNRKTSGMSDFNILKDKGFRIENTYNPIVFDRVNNTNRLLSDKSVLISPNCKWLRRDLEKVSWRGGKLDQTTDKNLSHSSDALGYLLWKLMPITNKSNSYIIFD